MDVLVSALVWVPQLYAVFQWNGIWRKLAAMPIAILVSYIIMLPILGWIDPAFYGPAPVIMKAISTLGTLFVGVLWLARVGIRYTT